MVKKCPVILNNSVVTVVKYDAVDIQFPSIHKNAEFVFVKKDNGTYAIVENYEEEKQTYVPKRNHKKEEFETDVISEEAVITEE